MEEVILVILLIIGIIFAYSVMKYSPTLTSCCPSKEDYNDASNKFTIIASITVISLIIIWYLTIVKQ